jgi:hypothetical protein
MPRTRLLAAFLNVYVYVSPIEVSVPMSVVVVVVVPPPPPLPPPQPVRMVADKSTIPSQSRRRGLVVRIDLLLVNIIFSFPAQACRTKSLSLSY